MRKRTEVWILFGTKLFCYRKENRSANRFRNEIVVVWEKALELKSFSEPNCSVMRKRTEEEIVFERKLFCYTRENRSAKRFRNKIALLWEREEKCEALWEQNCSLIGKRREVRSVFVTKLFCYEKENRSVNPFRNKIVLLWEREQKRKSFSKENCSVIGKKTEVRSVFGTKLFSYGKEKRSAKRFGNKIVL